ncbi:MAG: ABC transporter permease [Clostridiales bacterium]|nr:ABC transporter permease [Clostridiales bacterium]
MKIVSSAEQAIVKKDFSEVWDTRMARNTLIAVPALLAIVLPVMYLVMIYFLPPGQLNGMDQMMRLFPEELKSFSVRQSMFYLLTNLICPMFFLMIPLMNSTVSAACSFVGEKERGTIETLLLTPLSVKQIFKAKVVGCVLLSALSTAASFVIFAVVISAGDILLKMPFFMNWNWVVLVFLLAPALTVLGVIFMVMVSGKSKSYMESIQTSGYIVLPIVLLFVGQFAGLFQLNAPVLLAFSAGLFALDALLLRLAAHSFTPEKLLK